MNFGKFRIISTTKNENNLEISMFSLMINKNWQAIKKSLEMFTRVFQIIIGIIIMDYFVPFLGQKDMPKKSDGDWKKCSVHWSNCHNFIYCIRNFHQNYEKRKYIFSWHWPNAFQNISSEVRNIAIIVTELLIISFKFAC